jgi:hypothetical protein
MNELRGWMIFSWIALPTVMYGGYSLLQLLNRAHGITPFRLTWFRAGHAHAGVLLLLQRRGQRRFVHERVVQQRHHAARPCLHRDEGHRYWRDAVDLRYRLIGVWVVYRPLTPWSGSRRVAALSCAEK